MKMSADQVTAHNAGWLSQFRFAFHGLFPGVAEFAYALERLAWMFDPRQKLSTINPSQCSL